MTAVQRALPAAALVLFGCVGPAGPVGPEGARGDDGAPGADGVGGADGESGANGLTSLIRLDPVEPGAICENGGVSIKSGRDVNNDGELTDDEVEDEEFVCSGAAAGTNPACPGGIFTGAVNVTSSAVLASIEGCTVIDGSLTLDQFAFEDMEALSTLTTVTDRLTVGGASLRTLSGLENMRSIGSLQVRSAPLLASMDALSGLLPTPIAIVEDAPQLTSLPDWSDWTSVFVVTVARTGVTDLSGLSGLRTAERVTLRQNPALATLAGFGADLSIGESIEVSGNAALPECEANTFATASGAPTVDVRNNDVIAVCP